jgi:hypothetical protein
MIALLLSVNWGSKPLKPRNYTEETEPEATEPEEGYTVPLIPPGGLSAEEWDELAKRGEA